jgi:type I restriction enzyme S subunit
MLPEGWKRTTVGELCNFINGNGFKSSEWSDKGLPIIRIQNLNGSTGFNYFSGQPNPRWLVNPGDILFAWAGTKGVSFGAKRWTGPQGVLNQHIFKVSPKIEVNTDWLYEELRTVTEIIENQAHGFKSTLVHVQKADITEQMVNVPPIYEQNKIAKILSTWDQAITATERILANSRSQKRALMQQLLGSPEHTVQEGVKNFKRISNVAERIQRKSDGGEHPVLTISSLGGFVRQEDKYSRFMAGKSVESYILLKRGEFAYNKGNSKTYEFGCIFDLDSFDAGLVPHVYVCFKLKPGLSHRYFKYLFEADYLKPQLGQLVNTGVRNNGLLNIKPSEFMNTKVPVPSLEEQERIADILHIASKQIIALEQKLACLKQEKKALMQQLLTGKRRVKVDELEVA